MMMGPDDVYLANILKIIHLQSAKQAPKDTVCLLRTQEAPVALLFALCYV